MGERGIRADAVRNRDEVLRVAAGAFIVHGVDVPLQDIAAGAGVGIGTLYRHFPNREALIVEVYRREVEALCAQVPELLATLPPDQALEVWVQSFVRHVAVKRGMAGVLKDRAVLEADPGLRDLFTELHDQIRAALGDLLQAGEQAGTLRSDVDVMDLLRAIGGLCQAFSASGSEDQASRLASLLVDGLRFGAVAHAGGAPTAVR